MYCISKKYIELKGKREKLLNELQNIYDEIRDEISKKLKFIDSPSIIYIIYIKNIIY